LNVINSKKIIRIKKEINKNFNIDVSNYEVTNINCWGNYPSPKVDSLFYSTYIPGINSSMLYVVKEGPSFINILTNKYVETYWRNGKWMFPGLIFVKE